MFLYDVLFNEVRRRKRSDHLMARVKTNEMVDLVNILGERLTELKIQPSWAFRGYVSNKCAYTVLNIYSFAYGWVGLKLFSR